MKLRYQYFIFLICLVGLCISAQGQEYIGTDSLPMYMSTHTYSVEISENTDFRAANWYIYEAGTNTLNVQSRGPLRELGAGEPKEGDASIREIEITFDDRFTIGQKYVIVYQETAQIDQINCFDYRFYKVKISPQLDIDIEDNIDDDCPDGGSELSSIGDNIISAFNFGIHLESDYNCNYKFKLKISATAYGGTPTDNGIIQSIKVQAEDEDGDVLLNEDVNDDTFEQQDYTSVENTPNSTVDQLYVTFVVEHSQGFEQQIAISLYSEGSYDEVDVDSQPESGTFKIYRIPAAGDIMAY